jgi:predicted dehydrogenase
LGETVRVGLFGLGYWGSKYLRLLQEIPSIELTFVVDSDPKRLKTIRETTRIHKYSTPAAALSKERADAAVVVTPASTHRRVVSSCLDNSLDVLVEKPLALSLRDSIVLAQKAAKVGRILFPGHVYAFNDALREAAKIVSQSSFGEMRYVSCMRTGLGPIRGDTNALWDLVPHDLTALSEFGLRRPEEVVAVGRSFLQPGIEDVAFATLLYSKRRIANIQASWLDPYKIRRITAVGSRKMVTFDDGAIEDRVKVYERGVELMPTAAFGEFKTHIRSGDIHVPYVDQREPLRNLVEGFLHSRADPKSANVEILRALEIVTILGSMDRSMRRDGARTRVDWNPLDAFWGQK